MGKATGAARSELPKPRRDGWLTTGGVSRKSTLKSLSTYAKEHYPNAVYGAYPIENDTKLAVIIVANKYSPNNFW